MSERINLRNRWFLLAVGLLVFLIPSRWLLRSEYLYSWDSVNYALSIEEFNIHIHQPHPPGYLLYSLTLKAINALVLDPNLTMIIINIIATAGACFFLALLMTELLPASGFIPAIGAAGMYATNPVSWFYGCIAEIYALDAFFAAAVAYLVLSSFRDSKRMLWASVVLAIAGGFRPTTEVFLMPIYLAGFLRKEKRVILKSLVILVAVNLSWLAVLLSLSGGIEPYLERIRDQSTRAASKTSILLDDSPERGPDIRTIGIVLLQAATPAVLLLLLLRCYKIRLNARQASLFLVILPALAVYILIHFAKDGYLLLIMPAWIALLMVLLVRLYPHKTLLLGVALFACVFNSWIFLESPLRPEKKLKKTWTKWLEDEFRAPNYAWIVERNRVFRTFLRMVDNSPQRNFMILTAGNSNPHWRFIMYYRPTDEMLVTRQNTNFHYFVFQHKWRMTKAPILVNMPYVYVIGRRTPEIEMSSFSLKRTRHYYSKLEELPEKFEVYGVEFINALKR